MQGQEVIGWVKTPTTADVTSGIVTALQELLQQTSAAPGDIRGVMIGTTHFTNAVVQRRHLSPVAAVRLGLPATACVPPLIDWPEDLRELVGQATYMLPGDIGRLGLLERENAAVMNACLRRLGRITIQAFRQALAIVGLHAPLFLTQNDGTLMSAAYAEQYPVLTFASGPTNSMRGAAFLTGMADAMVIDIGGTTADVGALVKGFPRPASLAVEVGGVRTNFRMPDVYSFGLGGGSLITAEPLRIGPQSVGYELTSKALAFGGT